MLVLIQTSKKHLRFDIARLLLTCAALQAFCGVSGVAFAQELTPRAYWPSPKGINVFVVSYQRSTGDIVTDPSLPITGVDSTLDYLQLSYQRTFSLAGRTANIQLSLPYAKGNTEGDVEGEFLSRQLSGLGDTRVRLAVNLKGAPSMDPAGFQALRQNPETIIGASLLVQIPSGEYEPDKFLNLGTNRWSVKPALGFIWPLKSDLLLEMEVGAWFFGDNNEFVGRSRAQDPVVSSEIHLIKRIRPGFWASLDANYYLGGKTSIDGVERADLQRNSRAGVTLVFPIAGKHAIRGSFSTGIATESGGDFDMLTLSYIYAWR